MSIHQRLCAALKAALLLLCCVTIRCAEGEELMNCRTDRSMYAPGEQVCVTMQAIPAGAASLRAELWHLTERVLTVNVSAEDDFSLRLPDRDFTGYLLKVHAVETEGTVLATAQTGIDCSSSWTKFPRYGYVWDFTPDTDADAKIAQLNRYHLNGLQFYDWQYRHHQPVAPDTDAWTDWSGRTIDGDVVRDYIAAAHQRNMVCMAYNMIYAANQTYLTDGSGVNPAWRLVKASGQDFTCDMNEEFGPVGVLQYFNLLNKEWQRYIFAQENKVFDAFAFDGWHGDTIGENGRMKTADGEPLGYDENGKPIRLVKDCYTSFLNAAKAAIGDKYLVFNPVGAQGIENVNVSDVDVLYSEFWPWDSDLDGVPYVSYYSLHKAILNANAQSGGKSLVVAAYVNYRNPLTAFNVPTVRLMDSVVFASGGARIELGNGDGMLSDEYFPADRNKRMDASLTGDVQRLYDFVVAYENLLRDGQQPITRTAAIEGLPVSDCGEAGKVWCFAKADDRTEVYHFINLVGTDAGWRDEAQTKAVPTLHKCLVTRLYTDCMPSEVYLASPDGTDLSAGALPFTTGADENGAYVELTMPQLAYWNMIFLR